MRKSDLEMKIAELNTKLKEIQGINYQQLNDAYSTLRSVINILQSSWQTSSSVRELNDLGSASANFSETNNQLVPLIDGLSQMEVNAEYIIDYYF